MYDLKDKIDEGWSVQVYGCDRRLLCSLYPSHGWTFLAGLFVGLVLTLMMVGFQRTEVSSPNNSSVSPNPHEPLLQLD